MKKVAPDIDQLMWTLAEARDMPAIAEFEQRFPDLRLELAQRVAMVGGLRGARFEEGRPAPRFQPSRPPAPLWSKPLLLAGGFAVLLVFAWGAYSGTRVLLASRTGVVPAAAIQHVGVQEPVAPEPDPAALPVTPNPVPGAVAAAPHTPPYLVRISIRIEDAPLHTVLAAIASQSGLSLEIAPGMPNFTVSAAYNDQVGVQMLQDLGRRYGFSVLGQGENRVLLVPAVDATAQPKPEQQPTGLPGIGSGESG